MEHEMSAQGESDCKVYCGLFCLEPMFSGHQSLSQVVGWLQVRALLKAEV